MLIAPRGHSFTQAPHATQIKGLNSATLLDIICAEHPISLIVYTL